MYKRQHRNSGWKEEIAPSGKTVCKLWEKSAKFCIRMYLRSVSYTHLDVYKRQTQYCVTVYDQTFDKMYGAGMLKPIAENMEDFYEVTDESRYTEEMGLELEIDNGMVL